MIVLCVHSDEDLCAMMKRHGTMLEACICLNGGICDTTEACIS